MIKEKLQQTALYRQYSDIRWRERALSRGDAHPELSFYVIRRHSALSGLFSFYGTNLGSVRVALDRGLTPVVDMRDSPNPMLLPEEVGRVNAWELFFSQPAGYTMKDTDQAKNVILSGIHPPESFPDHEILGEGQEEAVLFWRKLAHRYQRLLPAHEETAARYYSESFGEEKVLGVLCRGTDYTGLRPHGHPVQPEPEEVIRRCEAHLQEHNMRYIYLATEDRSIRKAFEERFPGQVYGFQKTLYDGGERLLGELTAGDPTLTPYERNLEYLISVRVLSMCTDLIAGITSGTVGAVLMSDGYRIQEVFRLGLYE